MTWVADLGFLLFTGGSLALVVVLGRPVVAALRQRRRTTR
jgi:hypothetical protein